MDSSSKAAGIRDVWRLCRPRVSTHSRPKAAGSLQRQAGRSQRCFNTQPPEGGWKIYLGFPARLVGFNTQPPEGGWTLLRPWCNSPQSFNTQPPEGGCRPFGQLAQHHVVSTHSRPKAAGCRTSGGSFAAAFQHTAARRRLINHLAVARKQLDAFQHTAARRRLFLLFHSTNLSACFNTQPPEGGAFSVPCTVSTGSFNTQPPEGGWASLKSFAPSGFAAPISLSSQEKREREYNTAFPATPAFAIS